MAESEQDSKSEQSPDQPAPTGKKGGVPGDVTPLKKKPVPAARTPLPKQPPRPVDRTKNKSGRK
jgi:hypothetical protein